MGNRGEKKNFFSREKKPKRRLRYIASPGPPPLFKKSGVWLLPLVAAERSQDVFEEQYVISTHPPPSGVFTSLAPVLRSLVRRRNIFTAKRKFCNFTSIAPVGRSGGIVNSDWASDRSDWSDWSDWSDTSDCLSQQKNTLEIYSLRGYFI